MKIYLSFILFLTFTFLSFSQNDKAIMLFETDVINFGTIDQSANGRKTITFKNIGTAPLIIHEVKGSCGCVILDYPKRPILPNEIAKIDIVYNVLKLGKISRTVTITSNAKKKKKVIKVKGRVVKSL